ncbi:calcium-independent phospholipase A2-gamma-like [Embiotoca jacksoni]|uniref:calcium-independent phospholipase A2-gamma-like n=1 Tax=Embiotoca jacksoni TaxID=100190 RepID=UPI003703967D
MGRYLSANMFPSSVNRTLKTSCKLRYTMSLLRKDHRLAKAPLSPDFHRYSQLSAPQLFRFGRKFAFKNVKDSDISSTSDCYLRDFTKDRRHLQIVRFYSSSNRDAFRAEAPVGIFAEAQSSFNLSSLGGRLLGQSFNRLSRHINTYFKRKDVVAQNVNIVVTTPDSFGRSQRCRQSQRAATDGNVSESKDATQTLKSKGMKENSETSPQTQEVSRLQLFHISSLASRFGESYSYVAHHINSVFSQGFAKVQMQENSETVSLTRGMNKRQKRRKMENTCITNSQEGGLSQVELSSEQAVAESNTLSSSWEEGYLHFARHINKYFGAKVTDEALNRREQTPVETNSNYKKHFLTQSTSQTHSARSPLKKDISPETGGLFHSSSNSTNFGENYFQTSSHINQYFKGEKGLNEDNDGDPLKEMNPGSPERLKTVSFMDCLRHPISAIPDLLGAYLNLGPSSQTSKPQTAMTSPQAIFNKKFVLSRRQSEEMTRGLMGSLGLASSPEALIVCVEALNEHLLRYPSCKALIWQEKTAVTLLRQRRTYRHDMGLQAALRETLALIGYVDPVKGRGIRVLSIDGGGTRGLVPLQVLKLLENETGKKIHELFDYICGVSTGAVLAFMVGLARFSVEECADMYRRFGSEVFRQNRLVGTVKMGWNHSYYNSETWETILREKLGDRVLIRTNRDELSPKVSAVSAVVNWGTSPKAFVFRNYNHKPGSLSRYAGGSGSQMWQAVRASSAAPGYFQEFTLQSDIHQDGGIILNNPCALAVHESRLLWPKQHFQCVLSLGTGRYDNVKRGTATSTSLRAKISNLISSATDTEGVHTLLDELLAQDVYFRFNPMLSTEVSLDENRPRALDQLQRDTQKYLERNQPKLARLCLVLGAERSPVSRTKDWMSERAWEMKQKLM